MSSSDIHITEIDGLSSTHNYLLFTIGSSVPNTPPVSWCASKRLRIKTNVESSPSFATYPVALGWTITLFLMSFNVRIHKNEVMITSSWMNLSRSYQFSSVTQSCPTLCDPMNCSTPRLPVHHHLPEFTQTHVHQVHDTIQPSHPRSSPSPPASNLSQHQSLFQWVNSSHEVSKVLELQL